MTETYLTPAELIQRINKEFGSNTLVRACDAVGLIKPRLSTGSLSLDLVLGGGYPEGAITILEGEAQGGKSLTLNNMARSFLDKYKDGIYILINAEGTNDAMFLDMLGVDTTRTYFIQPDSGEQAWDAAIMAAQCARRVFLGFDSLDAMTPMAEIEGDVGDHKMAPAARMNNKGFRKLITAMRSDITQANPRVTAVFITQLREAIGIMFGDNKVSSGGKGKKFAATTIVRLACAKMLREVADGGDKDAPKLSYGMEIKAQIIKNKGWGSGEEVRFTLYKENYQGFHRGQIDNVSELIPYLVLYGIVPKAGNFFNLNGQRLSHDNLVSVLQKDDAVMRDLVLKVNEAHAGLYKKQEDPPVPAKSSSPVPPSPPKRLMPLPAKGKGLRK